MDLPEKIGENYGRNGEGMGREWGGNGAEYSTIASHPRSLQINSVALFCTLSHFSPKFSQDNRLNDRRISPDWPSFESEFPMIQSGYSQFTLTSDKFDCIISTCCIVYIVDIVRLHCSVYSVYPGPLAHVG